MYRYTGMLKVSSVHCEFFVASRLRWGASIYLDPAFCLSKPAFCVQTPIFHGAGHARPMKGAKPDVDYLLTVLQTVSIPPVPAPCLTASISDYPTISDCLGGLASAETDSCRAVVGWSTSSPGKASTVPLRLRNWTPSAMIACGS